jgi:hypothetical protein
MPTDEAVTIPLTNIRNLILFIYCGGRLAAGLHRGDAVFIPTSGLQIGRVGIFSAPGFHASA